MAVQVFASLARRSDITIDIGAYTGIFTLVATAVNGSLRAHAFEIVPDVYEALRENCLRNGVLDRVVLHNEGIGNPETYIMIPPASGGSALPDFYSSRLRFQDGAVIPFRSLDSLVALMPPGGNVLVKVDVEGTENDVFRFGQRFLSSFLPDILCEVLPEVATPAELEALLAPHGYHFYLVKGTGLQRYAHIHAAARFRDWFFTIKEPEQLRRAGLSGLA